jgi:hypothetical protein
MGISSEAWIVITVIAEITLFFKFNRFWSIRNFDLILLFLPLPALMGLVQDRSPSTWVPFAWLLLAAGILLVRCLLDLGLSRRPLLEPNLNLAGLCCLAAGLLALLLVETASTPLHEASARNPADPHAEEYAQIPAQVKDANSIESLRTPTPAPPPAPGKRWIAGIAQVVLVLGLIAVGWLHFGRLIAGLSVATCYLVLPYTRVALIDSGQLIPSASIVTAIACFEKPLCAGILLGLAAGWMPPALALIPLWAWFYFRAGIWRFLLGTSSVLITCAIVGWLLPESAIHARSLGARTLAEVGLLPGLVEAPRAASIWSFVDASYRIPVLVAFGALVVISVFWPQRKSLGELIALSAALLVACQFWYLDEGGALVQLYMPLLLLMCFRPNLAGKRPHLPAGNGSLPSREQPALAA